MTKSKWNLNLVGQWTVIVIGLVAIFLRLEHRMTTLEVRQEMFQTATSQRLVRLENKVDNIYTIMTKVVISEGK